MAIMPSDPGHRRVGVGADEHLPRPRKPLDVQVVADAVTGAREVHAVARRETLQETVIVRVLEVQLNKVVVHVLHGQWHLHAVEAQLLELQAGHGARRILQ